MKRFFCIVLIVVSFCLSFSSCKSPVSKLSSYEKNIYGILVENLSTFNDPSSVKVVKSVNSYYSNKILVLRISGKNTFGATVTNEYIMALETFKVYDAYATLEYYEFGHMPAADPNATIQKGTFYSLDQWGDPYELENRDDIPNDYLYLYQIQKYAIPEKSIPSIDISNLNKALDNYKKDMGW